MISIIELPKAWNVEGITEDEMEEKYSLNSKDWSYRFIQFFLENTFKKGWKNNVLTIIICIFFCLLGLFVHFLFFSGCFLFVIVTTRSMVDVMKSITLHYNRVLYTFVLVMIIIYCYASYSYVSIQNDFNNNLKDSCSSLMDCGFVIFYIWYKSDGGLGEYLDSESPSMHSGDFIYDPKTSRIIYDMIFKFFTGILIMSILSGIIIDSFSEIRENSSNVRNLQKSRCFICNLTKEDSEDNFNIHTKYRHNFWDYFMYIFFLKQKIKREGELNKLETYIISLINKRSKILNLSDNDEKKYGIDSDQLKGKLILTNKIDYVRQIPLTLPKNR
jgi:hypothetical protein